MTPRPMKDLRERLNRVRAQYDASCESVRRDRELTYAEEERATAIEQAQEVLQTIAHEVEQKAHDRIAGIVTHCLRSVFGDDAYEFQLVFEKKRGRTECRPGFMRDGHEVHPLRGAGGGTADVAAFALRLVCLVLSVPQSRRVLILDEPLKWLSPEYTEPAKALIEELSQKMGVQFIIVTHNEDLLTGKVIRISA